MSTNRAFELARQIQSGEYPNAAYKRLLPEQPEPTDFHRWFCSWHAIPPKVREFLTGTEPGDDSAVLLREFCPDFVSRNDFYDAAAMLLREEAEADTEPEPVTVDEV